MWIFVFRVKFYPPDVSHMSENLTRYYLTLQVRNDLISKKLNASYKIIISMCAYIVQSELGDYCEAKHGKDAKYIENFNFVRNQTPVFLDRVALAHR